MNNTTKAAGESRTQRATKTQARACYDNYFGTLRCLNGGTREENERSSDACRTELSKYVAEAKCLSSNPGKLLREDTWLMRALTEDIPNNFAAFCRRYPMTAKTEAKATGDCSGPTPKEYGDRWEPLREKLTIREAQYLNTYTLTGDIAALNALVLGIISQRNELLTACKMASKMVDYYRRAVMTGQIVGTFPGALVQGDYEIMTTLDAAIARAEAKEVA